MTQGRDDADVAVADLSGAAFLQAGGLRRLLAVLNQDGEETRIVGGAVRNALLQRPVTEVDLATTALPATVSALAAKAGLRPLPTGIAHGTVTVLVGRVPYEVTTLRVDVETDGRHATVRFGRSFAQDAQRRDFTINALSATPDGHVHDYTGGLADLAERRIRFIGEPAARIREDYLRILRFFRFHAAYGEGRLDPQGLDAALRERGGLSRLSRERIRAELLKLLVAPGAAAVVDVMSGAGLFASLIGGIALPARLQRVGLIEAARNAAPDALLRLAALAVLTVEDAGRLRERLRLSNAEAAALEGGARARADLHGQAAAPSTAALTKLAFLHGQRAARDAVTLAQAESRAEPDDTAWSAAFAALRDLQPPQMPITGSDLIARGIASGPALGAVLKRLQGRWIRAGFPREPAALAGLLDEVLDEVHAGLPAEDSRP